MGRVAPARRGRAEDRGKQPQRSRSTQSRSFLCELCVLCGCFFRCPLDLPDTAGDIASRIRTAGGDPANIFTREAVTLIHEYSRGLPRTISVMCDNALTSGFALDQRPVGGDIVREVIRDFDLHAAPGGSAAATPHLAPVKTAAAEGASSSSGAL